MGTPFMYERTIHFPDTDAAGVVFFANYLAICHVAYEESLAAAGFDVRRFFSDSGVVMPISHSQADYLRPLLCGDRVVVAVQPSLLTPDSYAVDYMMMKRGQPDKLAANVRTHHVCIESTTRQRVVLPEALKAWVG